MHCFYVNQSQISPSNIFIKGPDVNHIRNVLRMNKGDEIKVFDGQNKEYYCIIKDINKEDIILTINKMKENQSELKSNIILFQALAKKDKMELIIQKSVELGVTKIVPVISNRVIVKIENEEKENKKIKRWQLIAESAAKQSKRGIIPEISSISSFDTAINEMNKLDISLIAYENQEGISYTKDIISSIANYKDIGIFIGPEGGFEDYEVKQAIKKNILPISLGKRILRTETASLALISMMMLELDE